MRARFLLPLAALCLAAAAPAVEPIGRGVLPWWRHRFELKQRELAAHPPRLVLYGDSIMQYLEDRERFDYGAVWNHYFGGRNTADLGFKGDPTSALIWRLDHGEAAHIAPKAAIVLIGANNFGRLHWSAADTIDGIDEVLKLIHHKLPHTKVILLGVLPSKRSEWVDASTRATNAALAQRYGGGRQGWLDYIDVSPVFYHDGRLDTGLFIDPLLNPPDPPLHPSPEGWRRMMAMIEPVLARDLGDAPRGPMRPLNVYGR